jgi:predicted permease
MPVVRWVRAVLTRLRQRDLVEADLDDEVAAFYQTMVDRYIEQGMTEAEARRTARLKFGHAEQVKEEVRDTRAGAVLAAALRDAKYALRTLRGAPVYALVTIVTLGVGIGANSTIFSIASRFVLHHPPVGDPGTLMALHTTHDKEQCCNSFSWPLYRDLAEHSRSFSGLTAYYELLPASLDGGGEPERVWGQAVTANYFDVAQLPMAVGRGFAPDEEAAPLVVLSHGLWQRRFDADPNIAGRTVRLSGKPFTVAGVAPPSFRGLDLILNAQFWVPLANLEQLLPKTGNRVQRDYHWLSVAGRLRQGVTEDQAIAELRVLAHRFAAAHPATDKDGGFRFETVGSLPPRDRGAVLAFLAALTGVAFLVLCVACANVANLALAQASARRREITIRLAVGATRTHLLRQFLTESLLLALAGGVLGISVSLLATRGMSAFRIPAPVPLDLTVNVDWKVLLYTFALSAGAGLLFGLAPAWTAVRQVKPSNPRRLLSLRNLLVMVQVAMSVVLLCVTGLFLRSLNRAARIDIGFRPRGILMMSMDPRLHGYGAERTMRLLRQVRERAAALPGVVSAGCTDAVPLAGGHRSDGFQVASSTASVELYMATSGYFETMGIERIAGRVLGDEVATGPRVAVVNEAFAQVFFPNGNAIGQRARSGERVYEIVGLVKNIKSRTLGEAVRPVLFRAASQDMEADPSFSGYTLIVRYSGDSSALAQAIRQEIHAVDPALAVYNVTTMEEHLKNALFLPRLAGTLFGVLGFIGLTLAATGLYGVMSYWVSQRTREIGIRLAIGARIGGVQKLIAAQGMMLTAIAVVPGLAVAWAVAKLLTSFLYGVPPHDAWTFVSVPLFLTAVGLLACWLPARRAAKVDPAITLRHE